MNKHKVHSGWQQKRLKKQPARHVAIHCNCTENNNQGIIQNSPLCSTEKHLKVLEWRGWINDTIFIFGWAIPLRATDCKRQARWWKEGVDQTGTQTGSVSIQETRLFPRWMSELLFHSSCPLDKMLWLEKNPASLSHSICILHVLTLIQRTTLHHQGFATRRISSLYSGSGI